MTASRSWALGARCEDYPSCHTHFARPAGTTRRMGHAHFARWAGVPVNMSFYTTTCQTSRARHTFSVGLRVVVNSVERHSISAENVFRLCILTRYAFQLFLLERYPKPAENACLAICMRFQLKMCISLYNDMRNQLKMHVVLENDLRNQLKTN